MKPIAITNAALAVGFICFIGAVVGHKTGITSLATVSIIIGIGSIGVYFWGALMEMERRNKK